MSNQADAVTIQVLDKEYTVACPPEEKQALLEDALRRGLRLFFTHDAGCAMATVQRDPAGRFSAGDAWPEVCALEL